MTRLSRASRLVLALGGLVLVGPGPLCARQEPPADLQRSVFRAETEVVLLDVIVRDKKGRTVRDLRPEELEVYEDGVRQEVGSFRFLDTRALGESLEDAAAAGPPAPSAPSAPPSPRPLRGDASRHLNLVTLLFDQLDPDGRNLARRAALSFLELEDRPDVYVSVFQIGESLRLLQQFTTDRESVRHAVLRATGQIDTQYTAATDKLGEATARANALRDQLDAVTGTSIGGTGSTAAAQLGQEAALADMVVNALRMTDTLQREQQGQSSLFAILALARQQQILAGRKTILFFSEGVQAPPSLEHVLLSAISEANRANVSVYAVDARGLSTASNLAAARDTLQQAVTTGMRQQTRRGTQAVTREEMLIADTAESSLRMDTIGTLAELAESTGGALIANSNDVRAGLARAVGDLRGYYEIAYSPSNHQFDGRFRKIELKVSRPGVKVQTRSGYFAMPPGEGTATFPYEVKLLEAMRASPPPHDFALRARPFRFGYEGTGLRYTLVLEVPLDEISLLKDEDPSLERAHFSFMGVLRSSWGAVAEKFSQDVPLLLPRKRLAALREGNAVFMRSFTLPAGRYTLEAAAMDEQTGRKTVSQSRLLVPERRPSLALSSLAIVKRTEQVARGALASEDPFRMGEVRIVPWVTEPEVTEGRDLGIFLVAYVSPGATVSPALRLEFVHGASVVGHAEVALPGADAEGRIPYVVNVPAVSFAPGDYEVRAELASGPVHVFEHCSFRVAAPPS
jgi:VWFA-related protein